MEDQERKRREEEERAKDTAAEEERRRQEEAQRRAGASAAGSAASAAANEEEMRRRERMENKWAWKGDRLVAESVERKGPKKTVKEIQLYFPSRKVGLLVGKGGVNMKIIEGKSLAKLQIHKPKVTAEDPDPAETLVTIKGSPEVSGCVRRCVWESWRGSARVSVRACVRQRVCA